MNILGIQDNHDSGAALLIDGKVVSAVSEERINRIKCSGAFPWGSIDAVLKIGGLKPKDIDVIAVGTSFTPSFFLRFFPTLHHRAKESSSQYSYLLNLYIIYQVALRSLHLHPLEIMACRRLLKERFRKKGFRAEIRMVDHHLAHASSAYYSSPFDRALIITADAMGDGLSVTVNKGEGREITTLYTQSGFCSIDTYYSRITEYLGFRPLRHEGKVTGLAAYTEPPPPLLEHFKRQFHSNGKGFNRMNYFLPQSPKDRFHRFLKGWKREEIASALQRNLEEEFGKFVSHWVKITGMKNLALSGGVFANVKLNKRIHEVEGVEGIFIYPHMSDGGLAVGAGLVLSKPDPAPIKDLYLGPEFSEEEMENALKRGGIPYYRPRDPERTVAKFLVEGKVVGRFNGRMEWGPRALGNRSILYRPDDPSVNDWLNKRLKRSEFMPFAPVTLFEYAGECYEGLRGAEDTARFMTICFDCTPHMKKVSPGVVHKDGTARPQLIKREENPSYYRIVDEFRKLTNNPSIINTSFNIHEEPIILSPDDCIRSFKDAKIDLLSIGPFIASRDLSLIEDKI